MFESLSERLSAVIKNIKGHGVLSEKNIEGALKEVRLALLEADVHYKVVKDFVERVKTKALGKEVLESITPAQQFIKVVHEELAFILGGDFEEEIETARTHLEKRAGLWTSDALSLSGRPAVILLVGLQGSGKTTTTAKLAALLKKKGRSPYIVPADLQRPAAVLQLKKLSVDISVDCFDSENQSDPKGVCEEALRIASLKGYDTMLVDTAGRLHIDAQLMDELKTLKRILKPCEILLVADSMTGQDAVLSAKGFDEGVAITGVILTKLDSDARGGAALSMRMATGKPIKFIGNGEKLDCLESFYPDRIAGRILGMGDVLGLVEKAEEAFERKKIEEVEKKIRKDSFTLADFKDQLSSIKRMGSFESLMSMVPGFDSFKKNKGITIDERDIVRLEAIIDSMTVKERLNSKLLNAKRRIRIAKGSGASVQDVNRVIKQYTQVCEMMKKFKSGGSLKALRNMLPL